jgi:hypothetical protein
VQELQCITFLKLPIRSRGKEWSRECVGNPTTSFEQEHWSRILCVVSNHVVQAEKASFLTPVRIHDILVHDLSLKITRLKESWGTFALIFSSH